MVLETITISGQLGEPTTAAPSRRLEVRQRDQDEHFVFELWAGEDDKLGSIEAVKESLDRMNVANGAFKLDEGLTQTERDAFVVHALVRLQSRGIQTVVFYGDEIMKISPTVLGGAGRVTLLDDETNRQTEVFAVDTYLNSVRKAMLDELNQAPEK